MESQPDSDTALHNSAAAQSQSPIREGDLIRTDRGGGTVSVVRDGLDTPEDLDTVDALHLVVCGEEEEHKKEPEGAASDVGVNDWDLGSPKSSK